MRTKTFAQIPVTIEIARKLYQSGDDELKEKALEFFDEVELVTQETLISTFIHEARGDFALNVVKIDENAIEELKKITPVKLWSEALYPLIKSHERSLRFANMFIEYYENIDKRIILNNFKIKY